MPRGGEVALESLVVVLEEVGLSYRKGGPVPTLKVLHSLLDAKCALDRDRESRVAFIALSNTQLPPTSTSVQKD